MACLFHRHCASSTLLRIHTPLSLLLLYILFTFFYFCRLLIPFASVWPTGFSVEEPISGQKTLMLLKYFLVHRKEDSICSLKGLQSAMRTWCGSFATLFMTPSSTTWCSLATNLYKSVGFCLLRHRSKSYFQSAIWNNTAILLFSLRCRMVFSALFNHLYPMTLTRGRAKF